MGLNFHVHVGPYLEVPYAEQEVVKPTTTACPFAASYRVLVGDKFCPQCGTPTIQREHKSMKLMGINFHRFFDNRDDEDVVWQPEGLDYPELNKTIWIANESDLHVSMSDTHRLEPCHLDVELLERELALFSTRTESMRTALYRMFLIDSIVKYGVVPYYL